VDEIDAAHERALIVKRGVWQPVDRADEQGFLHPVHRGGDHSPFRLADHTVRHQCGQHSGDGKPPGFLFVTVFLVVLAIVLLAWLKKIKWR